MIVWNKQLYIEGDDLAFLGFMSRYLICTNWGKSQLPPCVMKFSPKPSRNFLSYVGNHGTKCENQRILQPERPYKLYKKLFPSNVWCDPEECFSH